MGHIIHCFDDSLVLIHIWTVFSVLLTWCHSQFLGWPSSEPLIYYYVREFGSELKKKIQYLKQNEIIGDVFIAFISVRAGYNSVLFCPSQELLDYYSKSSQTEEDIYNFKVVHKCIRSESCYDATQNCPYTGHLK